MRVSRRILLGGGTLAAALAPGKPRATEGTEKLRVLDAPRPAPPFSLTDADGNPAGVERFAGQGVVLNFWATWCPPCVIEMPALDRLHAMVAPQRILVLAASQDRGGLDAVRPFYERIGLRNLAIWFDPRGAAGRAFGIRGLPTTIIIDRAGNELARLEGPAEWDVPAMVARLRALLPPAPGTTPS
jgi:thiol-disulfide isomerase/thioredoxin